MQSDERDLTFSASPGTAFAKGWAADLTLQCALVGGAGGAQPPAPFTEDSLREAAGMSFL